MSVFPRDVAHLECPKCEMINYLDPFTFWNFKGKIKCAGCDAVWAYELVNGTRQGRAEGAAKGPHDKMPGFAQSKDWKTITDSRRWRRARRPGKTSRGSRSRSRKSIRGKPGVRHAADGRGPGRERPEDVREVTAQGQPRERDSRQKQTGGDTVAKIVPNCPKCNNFMAAKDPQISQGLHGAVP